MNRVEAELKEAAEPLRVPLFDVSERTASNMKTLKDLQTKLKRGREAVADDGINALLETAQTSAAGYPVVFGRMPEADAGQMRNAGCAARVSTGRARKCWPPRRKASPRCWLPVRRKRWRRASTQAPSSRRSRGTSRAAAAERPLRRRPAARRFGHRRGASGRARYPGQGCRLDPGEGGPRPYSPDARSKTSTGGFGSGCLPRSEEEPRREIRTLRPGSEAVLHSTGSASGAQTRGASLSVISP